MNLRTWMTFSTLGLWGALGAACNKTDECIGLEKLKIETERVVLAAERQAQLHDRAKTRALDSETAGRQTLRRLGLDFDVKSLEEALGARLRTTQTATTTAVDVPIDPDNPVPSESGTTVRHFIVGFDAENAADAMRLAEEWTHVPPMFRFGLLRREAAARRWGLELLPPPLERAKGSPQPTPLATPDDPSTIAREFGFCGANKLRSDIEMLRRALSDLRTKAERTTVLLPTAATWDGLARRAEMLAEVEHHLRARTTLLAKTAVDAKMSVQSIGYVEPDIVIEMSGTKDARTRFDTALGPLVAELKDMEPRKKGVYRVALPNPPAVRAARKHE